MSHRFHPDTPYPGHGAELDATKIRKLLDKEPWEESPHDEDQETRSLYLGTIFGLTPSGKYYQPFACSNVNACPECKGGGQLPNYKARKARTLARSTAYSDRKRAYRPCTACGGLGSREAHLDELWREYAEGLCESIGASLENGEGDACDLFVMEYREKEDDEDEGEEEPYPSRSRQEGFEDFHSDG